MSAQCETTAKKASGAGMGFFERFLTLWVFLCIVTGIVLGHWLPQPFHFIGGMEIAQVNLPVATAIVLFGFQSGAALATVVGVLIEVPVMLLAVRVVNTTRDWYESAPGIMPHERCCPPDVHSFAQR